MRAFLLVVSGLLLGVACGGTFKKTRAYDGVREACCTQADMDLKNFKGCRIGGRRCGRGEIYWMQGSVSCTAIDEANCLGGRCCHYRPRYRPGLGELPKEDQVDQFGRPLYPEEKKKKEAEEAEAKEQKEEKAPEPKKAEDPEKEEAPKAEPDPKGEAPPKEEEPAAPPSEAA